MTPSGIEPATFRGLPLTNTSLTILLLLLLLLPLGCYAETNDSENHSAFFLRFKRAGKETLLGLLDPERGDTALVAV
jgi:hypothetical protein